MRGKSTSKVLGAALCSAVSRRYRRGGCQAARVSSAITWSFNARYRCLCGARPEPGEKVTVSLGDQTRTATAGSDGKWSVKLDAMTAGGPYTLKVQGKDKDGTVRRRVWWARSGSAPGSRTWLAAWGAMQRTTRSWPSWSPAPIPSCG